ncbi:hypothetical protein BOTBODRAFT_177042 [Botryobasidium botryosum FD-172 SS1]|uniref:Glucose-methanol-choline oxidoreductase N-terminal domain-containing protein n=1 Tax=Botryobasidium botryosum (strain FD-172 SS1) TaxID=930990 RepID=A0A067MAB3_BOTB1|nr:hypothetical protein BOTBODRAFT_177042 [Botryobasidium botryosum FD-172 SS1]
MARGVLDKFANTAFDYLVIGGGTTGMVVAARLSEDPSVKVGVIEAGQYYSKGEKKISVPALFGESLGDDRFDWKLQTTQQGSVNNRADIAIPRGKVLGGTSAINTMTWGRASREEYNVIAVLTGCKEWRWDNFLKYCKKSESMHGPVNPEWAQKYRATFEPSSHGTSGPLSRSFVPWLGEEGHNSHIPFFETLNNLGVRTNPDSCSGTNVGVFTLATSIDPHTRERSYYASAYYAPNASRPNLVVLTGAHVRRIIFNPVQGGEVTATGVEFQYEGSYYTVFAKKDVIVSAGTYLTPGILERSGIGNPSTLAMVDVPTIVALPGMGENLQDHILVPSSFELKKGIITGDALQDPQFAEKEMELYEKHRDGQYTSIHSAFACLPAAKVMAQDEIDRLVSSTDPSTVSSHPIRSIEKQYELQRRWLLDESCGTFEFMHVPQFTTAMASERKPDTPYLSLLSVAMRPFSRGFVHINTPDPLLQPVIDPQYLDEEADVDMLVHALKFVRKVAGTSPLADITVTPQDPGPEVKSREAWVEYIKNTLESAHHPIGTASMLPREDGGVVDSEFKVYGTTNVRVVDASILPIHISAHPQATLYAMGEMVIHCLTRPD